MENEMVNRMNAITRELKNKEETPGKSIVLLKPAITTFNLGKIRIVESNINKVERKIRV